MLSAGGKLEPKCQNVLRERGKHAFRVILALCLWPVDFSVEFLETSFVEHYLQKNRREFLVSSIL